MSHRLVELAVPKGRKYGDGTYDTNWGMSQNPIRRISSATLKSEPSERILKLSEPKKIQTKPSQPKSNQPVNFDRLGMLAVPRTQSMKYSDRMKQV